MVTAESASLAEVPSPIHLTLLFKCARHTVLLSVLPSTPFTEIASLLLLALQTRRITHMGDIRIPSPDQGDQVQFGVPKDTRNLKMGFVLLDMAEQLLVDGRTGRKKAAGNRALPKENPAGAGLVDGSILAFRIKSPEDAKTPENGDDDIEIPHDPGWHVELPRFDDENE